MLVEYLTFQSKNVTLRAKPIPLLANPVSKSQKVTTAYHIMASPVLTIDCIIGFEFLVDILQKPFSYYPVLNISRNIVSMKTINTLIMLIENHNGLTLLNLTQNKRAISRKCIKL